MTSLPQQPALTTYGAVNVLTNAVPVVNPGQELDASYLNAMRNDLTGSATFAPIARMQILGVASGNPLITGSTTWPAGLRTCYASSPTPIAFTRNSTGNITCVMPPFVQDFLGNTGIPLNVTDVEVSVQGTAVVLVAYSKLIVSSNTFTIQLYKLSGGALSADDFVGQNIEIIVK